MSELLSEDQIAALVEAARSGDVPDRPAPDRPVRGRRVREIDFSRPTKFTQEQQRRFERSHETFCRGAASQLSAELRTPIELELINIAQLTWANAVSEVPVASTYGIVVALPIQTRIMLSIEQSAIVRLLERMLGGVSQSKPLLREPTDIEMVLTRRLFASILGLLSPTWHELMGITFEIEALETQVSAVNIAPPSEPTLSLTIEVSIEGASSTISLIVPYGSIASVASKMPSGQYGEYARGFEADAETAAAVRSALAGVEVELRAEVASAELTIDDVLALKAGDVVQLRGSVATGVTLCADAVPIHRARPGRIGSRRAVEILERLESDQ